MADMNTYLRLMVERSASDLFLTTGAPPSIKIDGVAHPLVAPKLMVGEVKKMAERIMTAAQRKQFETTMESNFSWACKDLGRYRINVYHQRGEVAMVMRMINSNVPSFEALGLPTSTAEMAMLKRGLVLMVGAAGSAKSVTEISELMQRGRLSEIKDAMLKGSEEGIVTFDQSLYAL